MKKFLALLLCLGLLFASAAAEAPLETLIQLGDTITVNGQPIAEDTTAAVHLTHVVETHADVPEELQGISNRVVTITSGGSYRISGTATDTQIAVKAPADADVRLILDGVDLTCRTHAAIAVYSARDPRTAGEYAVTIELAEGSENLITGSHNAAATEEEPEFDGAIGSQVSLGFEGSGSLRVDADNEGVEVAYGHLTINGGVFHIEAGDDPLNVSDDGVGVLTVNDGYLYSAVKNAQGGEGDGIDSNGWIVFNGGTAINLAHPGSQDGGIDSDMGSSINGGVIVGAGNMYDPIESDSRQLFMMLEFSEQTDDLIVVANAAGTPIFAYDFPHDYMYIAFSTPELKENEPYSVYLGGEIEGEQQDGLYTTITSYAPGTLLTHGGGVAEQRGGMQMPADMGSQPPEMPTGGMFGFGQRNFASIDLNELLKDADLNELLADKDLNDLLTGFAITDLLTEEQIKAAFGENVDVNALGGFGRGFGGAPHGMESSAETATTQFILTRGNTAFSNVSAINK